MAGKDEIKEKEIIWSIDNLDALIFDLDGVITKTAVIHMKAWEQMFESYLKKYQEQTKNDIKPYDKEKDYYKYIDGKPRYDGVQSLLESRGIDIPYGDPDDDSDKETICGLGNSKNRIFLDLLKKDGVHVFEDTIDKIKQWREKELKTAVISSSKNCKAVLETAKIDHLFDTRVDGLVSEKLNIPGKPAPDIFLYAAKQLQADPSRSAIFEDAIAGVQAGSNGNFKFVVGVARHGTGENLQNNGANLVIHNFNELK